MASRPKVFLSSTLLDLKPYREAAKRAIRMADCDVIDMDQWPAEDAVPVEVCLNRVDQCDAVVVIVGRRYGWIPLGHQPLSITRLEVNRARDLGKAVLAFLLDDSAHVEDSWDDRKVLQRAVSGAQLPANLDALLLAVRQQDAFKEELTTRVTTTFTSPDTLAMHVMAALSRWRINWGEERHANAAASTDQYLARLREATRWIDLRGIRVGAGKAIRWKIDDLYIALKGPSTDLTSALLAPRLVILGEAGSGKTTFVRRVVHELCRGVGNATSMNLPITGFPILIHLSQLDEFIQRHSEKAGRPLTGSPAWVIEYLSAEEGWAESKAREVLHGRSGVLFLDGLDQVSTDARREAMARLIEGVGRRFSDCRVVVTTRPAAYRDDAVLAGFDVTQIEGLDDDGVDQFLESWSDSLFPGDGARAAAYRSDLQRALDETPAIRLMSRNPLMLTALVVVVHWNDAALPEQRAELYESVLVWLAASRNERPGRMGWQQCLSAMGRLAWAMQADEGGPVFQMERWQAAEVLGIGQGDAALAALEAEEEDSGIIVSRGYGVAFWHRAFQEYLAARHLAGLPDQVLCQEILKYGRLYLREWRETMLLLGGILARQGLGRVQALFDVVTGALGARASFQDQARCVALLSALAEDLGPVGFVPQSAAYSLMLRGMQRLFEPGGEIPLDLQTRLEAVEALGVSAHPGIRLPSQDGYWVAFEGGNFRMGETGKEVTVQPFMLGRNPVTVWEYSKFVESGGAEPAKWQDQLRHQARPVVNVNWTDAMAYCQFANCRLPSEAEWEFAARGLEGREWAWGDAEPDETRANLGGRLAHPSVVGLFPDGSTPEGVVDMSGNVCEWTLCHLDEASQRNVLRGGCWGFNGDVARGAFRAHAERGERWDDVGFRCAR